MTLNNPDQLLSQAEKLCQKRNVRLTPQRLEVLRLMTQQPGAISAYDLLDLLRLSEPQAKPPTVIARWISCSNKVLFTAWNPPTATCCATILRSPATLRLCLSAIAADWSQRKLLMVSKRGWRSWRWIQVLSCVIRS